FGVTNLSSLPLTFPAWDKLLHPHIDWMGKVKYFVTISALFMVVGGWAFAHYSNKHEMLDIEFASGTSVQFQLKQPMDIKAGHQRNRRNPAARHLQLSRGRGDRAQEPHAKAVGE